MVFIVKDIAVICAVGCLIVRLEIKEKLLVPLSVIGLSVLRLGIGGYVLAFYVGIPFAVVRPSFYRR